MKKKIYFLFLLIFVLLIPGGTVNCEENELLTRPETYLNGYVEGVKYETGNWIHPDYSKPFEFKGNHRFVIEAKDPGNYIRVIIPWRRPDTFPEKKRIIVIDTVLKKRIKNVLVLAINNEFGDIVFEGSSGCKRYYIYYLPHTSTGGYYPKMQYLPPDDPADIQWKENFKRSPKISEGRVVYEQSINSFHSFYPMEIIALKSEIAGFLKNKEGKLFLFPEFRDNQVRMRKFLPYHWIKRGMKRGLKDSATRGEFYTFQMGVWSPFFDLEDLKVDFTGLISGSDRKVKKTGLECFNVAGIDLNGKIFKKKLSVGRGNVQPLWFGIDIPKNIEPGLYSGRITVSSGSAGSVSGKILLDIGREVLEDHGDSSPENMSRLRWLNSRIGEEKDFIVKPFSSVKINGRKISILGREIFLDKSGLPSKILSFFSKKLTTFLKKPIDIIDGPFEFRINKENSVLEEAVYDPFRILQDNRSSASWIVNGKTTGFKIKISGKVEYDGMINYRVRLKVLKNMNLSDIGLQIPVKKEVAKYMLGLGRKGGKRPGKLLWHWNTEFCQEGAWLGNVNGGLQFVLRDENYERPLNTNFYHNKPLLLPVSWGNERKGGIKIYETGRGNVTVDCFSGQRSVKKGDILYFDFRLLVTPFKLIDLKKHFRTRFVHKYLPVDEVARLGGTVVNVHHATEINPYINYPFFNLKKQKTYIDEAHKRGIKVKLYNTIRELTYKTYELFALRSLGTEIFNDGKGGGHSWLQEHLRSNYHSAWHATNVNDAAILNKGTSRWTNYYIEGLNWLAKNQEIDGLYLDDIAFSRETVKRIASVLNRNRPEVIIDLHSANQFNERDGFINSAFLYMEHFPYISRLWFGEYFEYDQGPDYWLTEVSGIPFGLTGEMLEKGGHPYRGMVYGMTNRVYQNFNPGELWKLFDRVKIDNCEMFGYWCDDSPVKTNVAGIRTTVYKMRGRLLIAVGSWSGRDENVELKIDWEKTGISKENSTLYSPEVKGLQEKRIFDFSQPVPVKKEKGIILLLEKKS